VDNLRMSHLRHH
jgi:hypothetical protein